MSKLRLGLFAIMVVISSSCKKEEENPEPIIPPVVSTDSVRFNFSFEHWLSTTVDPLTYEEPSGGYWTSLNYLSRLTCPVTVTKSTDAQQGSYSVSMETKQWGSMVIPGLLVMGTFIPQDPFVIQGKPYTNKPTSIHGYFKYSPADSDTCVLYARLSKFNTFTNKQDTIAEASMIVNQYIPNYSPFSLVFDYRLVDIVPDSLTILFVSSIDGANFRGHPGSKLWIDNLSINFNPLLKQ